MALQVSPSPEDTREQLLWHLQQRGVPLVSIRKDDIYGCIKALDSGRTSLTDTAEAEITVAKSEPPVQKKLKKRRFRAIKRFLGAVTIFALLVSILMLFAYDYMCRHSAGCQGIMSRTTLLWEKKFDLVCSLCDSNQNNDKTCKNRICPDTLSWMYTSPYRVFGLRDCSRDRAAFKEAERRLRRQWHPDHAIRSGVSKDDANHIMRIINKASDSVTHDWEFGRCRNR